MPSTNVLDRDVLAKIGPESLEADGISRVRQKQWIYRGIPWKERPRVQKIARQKRIAVPVDFLTEKRPVPKPRRAADEPAKAA